MNKEIQEIKNLFDKINHPAIYILKNENDNPKGNTQFYADKIDLPKYAVIYSKGNLTTREYKEVMNLDAQKLSERNCNSIEGILEELKFEGYKIEFKANQ